MDKQYINSDFKLGILGGGQLGKMMALAVGNWHLPLHFLDQSKDFPAGPFGHSFTEGNFKSYDDVYQFGKDKDVLTIEIEHVNTDALLDLEKEGVIVHPAPAILNIIKDKGLQKQFYQKHQLPTSPFQLLSNKAAILRSLQDGSLTYPFVQKSREAGYDGKGVAVINDEDHLHLLMDTPSMVEEKVAIKKELAVIAARNPSGDIITYPCVEMEFNPVANLVEFLICPAQIPTEIEDKAQRLARQTIEAYGVSGLLAVEFFWDQDDQVLINEVAPRPHNSGHHTINSSYTSQFEQHFRAILDLPLGNPQQTVPAAIMINLLGADGYKGQAVYEGLDKILAETGVYPHLYGKAQTKPYRKMGHITITGESVEDAKKKAYRVKELIRVISG